MKEGIHSIDLYYFTGTGNTLYLANQLKLRVRSYTPQNGRYPHPFEGVRDILIQKKAEFD